MSTIAWQPNVTLMGSITQNPNRQYDTLGLESVKVQVQTSNLTAADKLYLETTDQPGGTWSVCLAVVPADTADAPAFSVSKTLIKSLPDNNPAKLRRYLRWRLEGATGNRAGFKIDLALPCEEEV
jgi:hypothetical protein